MYKSLLCLLFIAMFAGCATPRTISDPAQLQEGEAFLVFSTLTNEHCPHFVPQLGSKNSKLDHAGVTLSFSEEDAEKTEIVNYQAKAIVAGTVGIKGFTPGLMYEFHHLGHNFFSEVVAGEIVYIGRIEMLFEDCNEFSIEVTNKFTEDHRAILTQYPALKNKDIRVSVLSSEPNQICGEGMLKTRCY